MKKLTILVLSVLLSSGLLAQTEAQPTQQLNYFNHTQVALLIGEESENQMLKAMIPSFQTTNGVRVGDHFGIGIGLGVEPLEYTVFPVFLSGYYYLTNKKNTPYFALKGGYAFTNSHKQVLNYYSYNGKNNNKGGLMFNPEIGVRFKVSDFDMTLSGGYRFQRLKSNYSQEESIYVYHHQVNYSRVSVTLGIMF